MDALKILEKPCEITWDYDEEADVLYLSVSNPRPALGVDIGEGLILRYDTTNKEVVGLTLMGLRQRLLDGLSEGRCVGQEGERGTGIKEGRRF